MNTSTLISLLSEFLGVIAVTMLLALSPRLAPLPIAFREPEKEARRALLLFAVVFVLGLGLTFIPGLNPRPGFAVPVPGTVDATLRQATLHRLLMSWICLIPVGFALIACDRCLPLPSVGWNARDLRPALQLGIALGLLTLFLSGRIFSLFDGVSLQDSYTLLVWVGIGLVEETIFRGYMQPRLSSVWGSRTGWLATAGLYTLYIVPALIGRADFLPQLVIVLAYSLALGWIMLKTGHVLAGSLWRGISGWIRFL